MSDKIKITELDTLEDVALGDWVVVVDTSDTTQSDEGTTKKARKERIKGVNWQGAWVAGPYLSDDVVNYNGSTYIATVNTSGEPTISADWDLFVEKGTDGIGAGAMLQSVYDPLGKNANAFNADNHVDGITNKVFTAVEETKLSHITVTQPVNLDTMESAIAAVVNAMVYKGNWDASAGTFPGAGLAKVGWFYTVSVGGTVNSVTFVAGDRLVATIDNASTTTFAGNWTQIDATDAVQSVAGLVGVITAAALRTALNVGEIIDEDNMVSNSATRTPSQQSVKAYVDNAASINFGDGSDGDVVISSTTTLTRDMFYNNLTVNSTLNTDGYRIFVKGTLSGTGTIANNNTTPGTAGQLGGTGGGTQGGGAGGPAKGSGPWKGVAGVAGSNGNDGSPTPSPGTTGISGNKGAAGVAGGAGGIGYAGEAGGPGGPAGTHDTTKPIFDKFGALNFAFYSAAATLAQYGLTGAGGGGGGSGRNTFYGGGGGGGSGGSGGVILIFAKTWAGTFGISATGAAGGAGGNGSTGGGGGGGGGGGNGGVVVVVFGSKTWTGAYTLTGGTGGAAGTVGSGGGASTAGVAGANGNTGVSLEYSINTLL